MDRSAAVVFGVITVVTVVVAALLLGASGPSEPTQPEPTPTVTPTAEPPDTSTPTATTTTPEPTPEPTTTTHPQPSFGVQVEPVPDTVYQRQFPVAIKVTNTGPTGEYSGLLTIDRDWGDHYDATVRVGGEVGANGVKWFNYTAQVGATGTYTVTLDGERVGNIDVRAWSSADDNAGSTTEQSEKTVVLPTVDVTGQSNAGAK